MFVNLYSRRKKQERKKFISNAYSHKEAKKIAKIFFFLLILERNI